jgi:hypothetical protein
MEAPVEPASQLREFEAPRAVQVGGSGGVRESGLGKWTVGGSRGLPTVRGSSRSRIQGLGGVRGVRGLGGSRFGEFAMDGGEFANGRGGVRKWTPPELLRGEFEGSSTNLA